MNGTERDFLDAVLIACIPTIPVAALAIRNYLTTKTNTKRIDNRPTRDEVSDAIHTKVTELTNGQTTDSGGTP